jgi:parallel beta-helix repeat protein
MLVLVPASSAAGFNPCYVTVSGENVGGNAIQLAINANPGRTICVAGGTYPEQLIVTSSGTQLIGLGSYSNPTTIQPETLSATANVPQGPDSGQPIYSTILVGGSPVSSISGVKIENLVIDGSVASEALESCIDFRGVTYLDASGTVAHNSIENFRSPASLPYCNDGMGVEAESAVGGTSNVVVQSNAIGGYDSTGIICNWDAYCSVFGNTVSFYTPYDSYVAGEGIQIGYGASGQVSLNIVENNACTFAGCGPNPQTQSQGIGIVTYLSGAQTTVSGNILYHNDVGIYVQSDTTTIIANSVSGSTFEAIVEYDGAGTYRASFNLLANNPIGFELYNDGSVSTFTSIVQSSNYFGHDPTAVQIQTTSPGSLTLSYGGTTQVYSGTNTVDIP